MDAPAVLCQCWTRAQHPKCLGTTSAGDAGKMTHTQRTCSHDARRVDRPSSQLFSRCHGVRCKSSSILSVGIVALIACSPSASLERCWSIMRMGWREVGGVHHLEAQERSTGCHRAG